MGDGDNDKMKVGEAGRSERCGVALMASGGLVKSSLGSFAREMEGQDARAATSSLSQLHEDKRNAETSAFSILDFTCQVEHASLLTTRDAYIEVASKLGQRR